MLAFKSLNRMTPGPEVIKKFELNKAEHEISVAQKYKNIKKFSIFFCGGGGGDYNAIFCSCSQMFKCQQLLAF